MTAHSPTIIGSMRSTREQRATLFSFVRAFYNGDLEALLDFAISLNLYSSGQPRAQIRWRLERTVIKLKLGGDGR